MFRSTIVKTCALFVKSHKQVPKAQLTGVKTEVLCLVL